MSNFETIKTLIISCYGGRVVHADELSVSAELLKQGVLLDLADEKNTERNHNELTEKRESRRQTSTADCSDSSPDADGEAKKTRGDAGRKAEALKKSTYGRMRVFLDKNGAGAGRLLLEASDGKLTDADIMAMRNCEKVEVEKWKVMEKVLDRFDRENRNE